MSIATRNTAENRFRAIVAGGVAFVSFGVATWLMLMIAGNNDESVPDALPDYREGVREANLKEVKDAQAPLTAESKLDAAMKATEASLGGKVPKPSPVAVPGTPAATPPAAPAGAPAAAAPAAAAPTATPPAPAPAPKPSAPATPAAPAPAAPAGTPTTAPAPAAATPAPAPAK